MNQLALLPTPDQFTQIKEIAQMAVKSGLLPASIKTSEAAAIIALKGYELGLPPMVAFAHIHVIQGKPTMSAEIMLASIYKDHPSCEIQIVERSAQRCVIKARRPNEKELQTFIWDIDRAKRMGLTEKDNWKKQPETMLFWRCITEMKRAKFPEVLMGIDYSPEELEDLKDVTPKELQGQGTQPTQVQSIKNFAPQSAAEAEERLREKAQQSGGSENPEPNNGPSEKELVIAQIKKCCASLKLSGEQIQKISVETFNCKTDALNLEQMKKFAEILLTMTTNKKSEVNNEQHPAV